MGKVLAFVIGSFILYNLRVRVINHIAKHQKGRLLRMHIALAGVSSCLLIFFFPKIVARLGINKEVFIDSLNIPTILLYVGYISIAGILIHLGYVCKIWEKHFAVRSIVFSVLFSGLTIGGLMLNLPPYIVYFSIVAFAEEYIKYIFGWSLFAKLHIHHTDLLLFCFISGFAFAFVENGVYAWYAVQKANILGLLPKRAAIFQTLMQRGIVNVALHGFFTGIIGRCTLLPVVPTQKAQQHVGNEKQVTSESEKNEAHTEDVITSKEETISSKKEKKNLFQHSPIQLPKIIGGILCGVAVHAIFNSMVSKGFFFIMPIVVLVAYIVISYIFYKSDTLFNQPPSELQEKSQKHTK